MKKNQNYWPSISLPEVSVVVNYILKCASRAAVIFHNLFRNIAKCANVQIAKWQHVKPKNLHDLLTYHTFQYSDLLHIDK